MYVRSVVSMGSRSDSPSKGYISARNNIASAVHPICVDAGVYGQSPMLSEMRSGTDGPFGGRNAVRRGRGATFQRPKHRQAPHAQLQISAVLLALKALEAKAKGLSTLSCTCDRTAPIAGQSGLKWAKAGGVVSWALIVCTAAEHAVVQFHDSSFLSSWWRDAVVCE